MPHKLKRARPNARPRPSVVDDRPSVVVDVDVDLVRYRDRRLASAQAELAAEEEQKHQYDDDQQDDGKDSTAAASAGFDDGRAIGVAVVVGHGNSPCLTCC